MVEYGFIAKFYHEETTTVFVSSAENPENAEIMD